MATNEHTKPPTEAEIQAKLARNAQFKTKARKSTIAEQQSLGLFSDPEKKESLATVASMAQQIDSQTTYAVAPISMSQSSTPTVICDLSGRDSRSIMDIAMGRLSKSGSNANKIIEYKLSDGYARLSSGPAGMATIWDYDIILMAVSNLTESLNNYRNGNGEKPDRIFRSSVTNIFTFCRRSNGGKQKQNLIDTFIRLNTTHIAMERRKTNGESGTIAEGESLIASYKIYFNKSGKPELIEIEMARWMYEEIMSGKNPDVLAIHRDYFLIDSGIGRFLYRLARRAAGRTHAKWSFKTIYEHSGSVDTANKFNATLRKLIKANDLPEYDLQEEKGTSGPLLIMAFRSENPQSTTETAEDSKTANC